MTGINIIFDGPPGHDGGRFVEIENDAGESVRIGEWAEDGRPGYEGMWRLKITVSDILDLVPLSPELEKLLDEED